MTRALSMSLAAWKLRNKVIVMILLNKKSQLRTLAKNWHDQYGEGSYSEDKRGRMVGVELAALDPETASIADVEEIIGNSSWIVEPTCDECSVQGWDAVEVGDRNSQESNTAVLCRGCLQAALKLLDGA